MTAARPWRRGLAVLVSALCAAFVVTASPSLAASPGPANAGVPAPGAVSVAASEPTVATCLAAAPQVRGQTDPCVKLAQVLLDRQGFGRPLDADGIFGARTQAAVNALQTTRHLTVSGKLDAPTWRSLATGPNLPYPAPPKPAPPSPTKPNPPTVATCLATAPQVRGQTNACVKLAQTLLDRQGFGRPLPATGYFGALTQAAVTALQTTRHLSVTGKLDAPTWRSLATGPNVPYPAPPKPAPPSPTQPKPPTVATCLAAAPQLRGQTNACVKLAQVLLDRQGFGRPLEADGIFGAGTQAAVTALQTKRHLTVTGKLDAATWRSLATGPNVPYPTPNPPPPSKVNCAVQACIALTFDDGPVTQTAELLDTLKRKQAKATFFVVGESAARHPEILRRMVAEGHVVGNHTMTHAWLTRLGTDAVRKEITGVNDLIKNATGQMPRLFRPPYGATNATVASVTAGLGMAQIMWEADPRDWADRNAATVRDRVLALARNGTIVVSHDIHATTRAAYAEIIDGLRAKGYVLVTVPELLGSNLTPGKIYYRR